MQNGIQETYIVHKALPTKTMILRGEKFEEVGRQCSPEKTFAY